MSDASLGSDSNYAFAWTSGESSSSGTSQVPATNKRASSNAASDGSNRSSAQATSTEPSKVPKWFKVGK